MNGQHGIDRYESVHEAEKREEEMSLENIENRVLPRVGVFPRKLENQKEDTQRQPVHPVRILKEGVEVSEELKHKIEVPPKGLLEKEQAENYLHRVEDGKSESTLMTSLSASRKVVTLHSLRASEIQGGV